MVLPTSISPTPATVLFVKLPTRTRHSTSARSRSARPAARSTPRCGYAGNDVLQPLANAILDDTVNFGVDPSGSNCGNSTPIGATCDLSFFFTPQSAGSFVGHYTLNDSSVAQTQIVTLIGNAPPPPRATVTAPSRHGYLRRCLHACRHHYRQPASRPHRDCHLLHRQCDVVRWAGAASEWSRELLAFPHA